MTEDIEGKYVCPDCIDDYAIQDFIRSIASENTCSYCGRSSDEEIAASLDEVVDFMLEGINSEYDDPNNCVGWEGGWQGADVFDSHELITDVIGLECSSEELYDDIILALGDQEWCYRDPYGLRDEEALKFGWDTFCEQVKHRSRYIFFRIGTEGDDADKRSLYSDEIPVAKMLDHIKSEMLELEEGIDLAKPLPVGTTLYRVRIHNEEESPATASSLGTVPLDKAIYSNRMSPAGIPMFYGALDPETALKETLNRVADTDKLASIATFTTLKEINVLDLTELPNVPSLFDQNIGYMRSALKFMHSFVADISKPIAKDGLEHIDYVPTQVFTEYIRYQYVSAEGDNMLGIIYPSAKQEGGKSIVLFFENEHCCDDIPQTGDGNVETPVKYLKLKEVERRALKTTNS